MSEGLLWRINIQYLNRSPSDIRASPEKSGQAVAIFKDEKSKTKIQIG